jgi:hypothetical protein
MENDGSSKANTATALSSVGDIEVHMICKQNCVEYFVTDIYTVTICYS